MRFAIPIVLLLCTISTAADKIAVKVDPRVELLSIVFRLVGNPEYNMKNSASPYAAKVDEHFKPFADHETVKLARQLRAEHGISFDAVMSMAVHLTDEPWNPKPRTALDPRPELLEGRWTTDDAQQFIDSLAVFCRDSNFDKFIADNQEHYIKAAAKLDAIVNAADYVGWFDKFFGARPQATFTVIVGMLNGGGNYGVSMRHHDGREEITPVIGIYKWDKDGLPAIGEEVVPTIVHEFCHSYTNALIDKHYEALAAAGDKLFELNSSVMKRQAYATGRTVLYESLVRAVVSFYMADVHGPAAGKKQQAFEIARGFKWTAGLVELLAEYSKNRDKYADFDAFMPQVIEFFNKAAGEQTAAADKQPKVVAIEPANGAKDVDAAAVTKVVITFDRPMRDKSWSIVGGGEKYPKFERPAYDAACKVLTVPVKLEPGKTYVFGLNSEQFKAFASKDGVPLEPILVTFTTAP